MHGVSRFVACLAILCLGITTRAAAEPVSITSGFLLVTGPFEPGGVSIRGTRGFSVDARVTPGEGRVDPMHLDCAPLCLPGSTISIGAFLGGPAFTGTATLDGTSYDLGGGIDDPAVVALEFVGRAIVPAEVIAAVVLTAPFTTAGLFSLPADVVPLQGAGAVTLWLQPVLGVPGLPDGWTVDQIRYDFSDTADPIPEPATLTLLGSGLGLAALRIRRRPTRAG